MACCVACSVTVQPERSTAAEPPLYSSINGCTAWVLNSLIFTGRTLRTFSAAISDRAPPALIHEALATRSPFKAAVPEVTLNVALTLAPGATGPAIVAPPAEAVAVQPFGGVRFSLTPVAGASPLLVNVTVVSCDEPGENVCNPGAFATEAGARLTAATA